MHWDTLKNGELLRAMVEAQFNVLLTADKSLPYQQNLDKHLIQVVIIRAKDNRFRSLALFVGQIKAALETLSASEKVRIVDLRQNH